MVTKCLVCKKRAITGSGISFHQLPKDEDFRKVWVEACYLNELYISQMNTGYKICSNHFKDSDFRVTRIGGPKILKPKAIPFVLMNTPKTEVCDLNSPNSNLQSIQDDHASYSKISVINFLTTEQKPLNNVTTDIESGETRTDIIEIKEEPHLYELHEIENQTIPESDTSTQKFKNVTTDIESGETRTDIIEIKGEPHINQLHEIENQTIPESDTSTQRLTSLLAASNPEISNSQNESDSCELSPANPTKTRRIWRPSRISDCTEEHFSTPREARRNLDLAKSELKAKQRKIKTLLQKNCRLLKKLKTYENIIARLRSKMLRSENLENILQTISSNKLRGKKKIPNIRIKKILL